MAVRDATPSLFSQNTTGQNQSNSTFQPTFRKRRSRAGSASDDLAKKDSGFKSVGDLFSRFQVEEKNGYISREFQDYGYQLAVQLDDLKHTSLYIKLAKEMPRGILEQARSFVSDANARSKAKLFMWKVKQLQKTAV